MVEVGKSLGDIQRELGVHPRTTKRYFPQAGRARGTTDQTRNSLPVADPARFAQVGLMVAQGFSVRAIQRETGTDPRTVTRYFPNAARHDQRGGIPLPVADPEKYAEMGRLVADGASLNEIMNSTGSDHHTIKRYFPNAGWGSRGGRGASMVRKGNELLDGLELK